MIKLKSATSSMPFLCLFILSSFFFLPYHSIFILYKTNPGRNFHEYLRRHSERPVLPHQYGCHVRSLVEHRRVRRVPGGIRRAGRGGEGAAQGYAARHAGYLRRQLSCGRDGRPQRGAEHEGFPQPQIAERGGSCRRQGFEPQPDISSAIQHPRMPLPACGGFFWPPIRKIL